jgi:hypothetical protein
MAFGLFFNLIVSIVISYKFFIHPSLSRYQIKLGLYVLIGNCVSSITTRDIERYKSFNLPLALIRFCLYARKITEAVAAPTKVKSFIFTSFGNIFSLLLRLIM